MNDRILPQLVEINAPNVVRIGWAPNMSRNCPWYIRSANGLTSTFKSLEKLRYELRNTWNYPGAETATRELRAKVEKLA